MQQSEKELIKEDIEMKRDHQYLKQHNHLHDCEEEDCDAKKPLLQSEDDQIATQQLV